MNIYVVRHGQTDWNIQGKLQGQIDIPLNPIGIKQAKQIAKIFKDISIDFIISSPLSRAFDTANCINITKNLEIITSPKLIERSFGEFEGLDDLSQFNCNIHMLVDYHLNYSLHHVEPIQDLFKRVENFIEELKEKYRDKQILLVTHNGIAQVIESILNNLSKESNLLELGLENCEYRRYFINE